MADSSRALDGADDGITAAFELVLTPVLFAVFGYFIDGWLGTTPLFILLLAGIVFGYEIWKLWFAYTRRMKEYEASLPDTGRTDG